MVAEAFHRAADECREQQVLGRPLGRRVEADSMLVRQLAARREVDRVSQFPRLGGHARHGLRCPAPSGTRRTLRHVRRLRSLSETECYVRLYGGWDSTVTLVKIEPRRPRYELAVSGEDLRRDFEARIEARTEELISELEAAEAAAEAA
jgi:hypothetical protein